eukprot:gb/GECG01001750.1/.p1 GENE.gb/GECG01001750.1/~~gb/GECG01001750.1/.p1  ORF type:complete len:472 (+),score=36.54 gb/GECG01001750.1/:1-1416(+)
MDVTLAYRHWEQARLSSFRRIAFRTLVVLVATCSIRVYANDLRSDILDGIATDCIDYNEATKTFHQHCSLWSWNQKDYISLGENETFNGHGYEFKLGDATEFEGLFVIMDTGVLSFDQAPLITNVHTRNGETSPTGGFIVQSHQKYFKVHLCSSTGLIKGDKDKTQGGGGICGQQCGSSGGHVLIYDSYSSGEIAGYTAGGIAGRGLGLGGGFAEIRNCHSSGIISGLGAGGICGNTAGALYGRVIISQSYSTGTVSGVIAGGIVGPHCAGNGGGAVISQCFSTGNISGIGSGGIAAAGAGRASEGGTVEIRNCYSRGHVVGHLAGGICGSGTGVASGVVVLNNTYSSGEMAVPSGNKGGLIGSVWSGATIHIWNSVYRGGGPMIGGDTSVADTVRLEQVSNNIDDIVKRLYCYNNSERQKQCWPSDIWAVDLLGHKLPLLKFQRQNRCVPTGFECFRMARRSIRILTRKE